MLPFRVLYTCWELTTTAETSQLCLGLVPQTLSQIQPPSLPVTSSLYTTGIPTPVHRPFLKLFLRLLLGIFLHGPLLPPSDEELIVRCIQTSQRTQHYMQLLIFAACLQLLFHSC